jgi:hypothetical protein
LLCPGGGVNIDAWIALTATPAISSVLDDTPGSGFTVVGGAIRLSCFQLRSKRNPLGEPLSVIRQSWTLAATYYGWKPLQLPMQRFNHQGFTCGSVNEAGEDGG